MGHRLLGEDHVGGREGPAVVPGHTLAQAEGEAAAVGADRPRLGEVPHEVQVAVEGDQAVVDKAAHLVRIVVARDVGDQTGDVAQHRVDQGVAVGRLVAAPAGHPFHHALDLALAADEQARPPARSEAGTGRAADCAPRHSAAGARLAWFSRASLGRRRGGGVPAAGGAAGAAAGSRWTVPRALRESRVPPG